MNKHLIQFKFPNTANCLVVWYRNGLRSETKIRTPWSVEGLKNEMFKHRVGISEIRAIKADNDSPLKVIDIDAKALAQSMSGFSYR